MTSICLFCNQKQTVPYYDLQTNKMLKCCSSQKCIAKQMSLERKHRDEIEQLFRFYCAKYHTEKDNSNRLAKENEKLKRKIEELEKGDGQESIPKQLSPVNDSIFSVI